MKPILIAAALLFFSQHALAQVVECIDAKGAKTIAQFCPPGTVKEIKRSGPGSGAGAGAATNAPALKSLAEQDAGFKKRAAERQEADTKAEKERGDAKTAERNCNDARAQLKQLQEGMRISKIDPTTGDRTFLEDKDRPGETANAQKSVDSWCKK
jgi:hypothetical protein